MAIGVFDARPRLRLGWRRSIAAVGGAACLTLWAGQLLHAEDVLSSSTGRNFETRLAPLGEYLFRSPSLSRDGSVSCQTCHIPALGFSGDRPLAVGLAGFKSNRRAPALLGLKRAKHLMWDGRASSLRDQAAIPLESQEMAVDWPVALSRLRSDPQVNQLSGSTGYSTIDRDMVLRSLASYVASLDAGKSRFDRYYFDHDEKAMTEEEVTGFRLFVRRARCSSCHLVTGTEAPFTDDSFHATGIGCRNGSCADRGRGISGNADDEAAFKTPGLRGVALRPYLMHDGSVTSLQAAVERYNRGPKLTSRIADERLGPLYLNPDEVRAIVAFMGALTPENLSGKKLTHSKAVGKEIE